MEESRKRKVVKQKALRESNTTSTLSTSKLGKRTRKQTLQTEEKTCDANTEVDRNIKVQKLARAKTDKNLKKNTDNYATPKPKSQTPVSAPHHSKNLEPGTSQKRPSSSSEIPTPALKTKKRCMTQELSQVAPSSPSSVTQAPSSTSLVQPKKHSFEKRGRENETKTEKMEKPKTTSGSKTKNKQCAEENNKEIKEKKISQKSVSVMGEKAKLKKKPCPSDLSDPMAMLMMMEGMVNGTDHPLQAVLKHQVETLDTSIPSSSSPSTSKSKRKPTTLPSSGKALAKQNRKKRPSEKSFREVDSASEEFSDWEDVHDHPHQETQLPDKPVEITLDLPDVLKHRKRKKKEFDWKGYLQRRVKRFKKEVAMDMHKVHLLCLLSLGLRQNEELNDLTLTGLVLSVLPAHLASVVTREGGSSGLEKRVDGLLLWYKKTFSLEHVKTCTNIRLVLANAMEQSISKGKITDARVWVMVFICILRTVGLSVRLVLSFQAISYKALQEEDKQGSHGNKLNNKTKGSSNSKGAGPNSKSSSSKKVPSSKTDSLTSKSSKSSSSHKDKQSAKSVSVAPSERRKSASRASSEAARKNLKEVDEDNDGEGETTDDEEAKETKGKKKRVTKKKQSKSDKLEKDPEPPEKVLSSNSEAEEDGTINRSTIAGHDFWLEIFFPEKKKWLCYDCFKGQFGKPYSLENSATQPLSYVVAFKNDGGVKDVTPRYAKMWLSHTRKQRVDQDWWDEALAPLNTTPHRDNLLEDDEIKGQLLVRPMPTSIADFKGHPLYALRRHLLKFEAIYPDSAIPVGYIKQEPVYARECVHTLHSRDNWLKEGRLVRIGEEAYKMVKSRPKWNKPKENPDELDLELYGEWQTEKYIPPPAVNGKVPKNEYGNLELFKPWMLPLGTVQLRVNGLQRVAKKLNIDVAPAMVGWDHHCGHAHPVFDGVVVCEEYADALMLAWTEDQEIQSQRETEKREKRVYGNWRLLIKGLLIKLRLTQKFLQDDPGLEVKEKVLQRAEEGLKKQEKEEEDDSGVHEPASDVQHSWPRRQQDEAEDKKMRDNRIKLEKAQSLLVKGVRYGAGKSNEQKKKASVSKVEPGDTNETLFEKVVTMPVATKSNKRDEINRGRKSLGLSKKSNEARKKGRDSKNKVPQSSRSASDGSDSEEDFTVDEVDGGKANQAKASGKIRPRRRSAAQVKYFENENDSDFLDDSDKDQDFDLQKELLNEKKEQFTLLKDNNSSKFDLSEDDSSDDESVEVQKGREDTKSCSPSTSKPEPDPNKHWLDEGGSSSDEGDFIAVEPVVENEVGIMLDFNIAEKTDMHQIDVEDNTEEMVIEDGGKKSQGLTEHDDKSILNKRGDRKGKALAKRHSNVPKEDGVDHAKENETQEKEQHILTTADDTQTATEKNLVDGEEERKQRGGRSRSKRKQTEDEIDESIPVTQIKVQGTRKTRSNSKGGK